MRRSSLHFNPTGKLYIYLFSVSEKTELPSAFRGLNPSTVITTPGKTCAPAGSVTTDPPQPKDSAEYLEDGPVVASRQGHDDTCVLSGAASAVAYLGGVAEPRVYHITLLSVSFFSLMTIIL